MVVVRTWTCTQRWRRCRTRPRLVLDSEEWEEDSSDDDDEEEEDCEEEEE